MAEERPKLNSPNSFCWIELACNDLGMAKEFYGSLMGWKFKDTKVAGGVYSTIKLGNKGPVGGAYEFALPQEPKKKKKPEKIPAFWGSYIATKNIKAMTNKAESLGGSIAVDVTDLGETGFMSVIQDPTGALFGLWQSKDLEGFGPSRDDEGASGWNELLTHDMKSSLDYYTKLFNWKPVKKTFHHDDYIVFTLEKKRVAGMMQLKSPPTQTSPHWLVYFNVHDCDKSTKLAVEHGAKMVQAPMTVKGAGRMSVLEDGEGAMFALIHYDPTT